MGYYIETGKQVHGKAQWIVDHLGGEIIEDAPGSFVDIPEGKAIIVVVDNGPFEAACFCYNEQEFKDWMVLDWRDRQYVLMDRDKAERLSGFEAT